MRRLLLIIGLAAFLSFPIQGFAQDEEPVCLDAFIEQLSAQCPFGKEDEWAINSVQVVDDTVSVEIQIHSTLASFMPMLAVDNEKGKRLWVNHLSDYGDQWKRLVELTLQEGRVLLLGLKPRGGRKIFYLACSPEELGTILAKD